MDIHNALVTKIVDEGQINETRRSGITADFLSEESGAVYNYIIRHYTDYKKVPARDTVKLAFPNYQFSQPKEPLVYYINAVQEAYRRAILDEQLTRLASVYQKDTKAAESLLRETLSSLHVTQKSHQDVNIAESAVDRYEAYEVRKQNPGANGILSNWSRLDYQTLGWQPEEFAVLVAEKYMGKSWLMIWLGIQAAFQGEKVLFVTKEMSQIEVSRRIDSIIASVCFESLRHGVLTHIEEERFKEKLGTLASTNFQFIVARQGVSTIEDIQIKAVETDATIVFGDSIYLFDPDSRGRYQGEVNRRLQVSQNCKRIASELGMPLIVSVQAGRKKTKQQKPDLDDIEWSNAFSQDANTVVYLEKDDLDLDLKRAHMYVLKSRDGQKDDFFINQDFEQMRFEQRDDETEPTYDIDIDEEDEVILDGADDYNQQLD